MLCKKVKPNVSMYKLVFTQKDDPSLHYRCMWANIYLDHNEFTLFANTDCGDFSYSWPTSDGETFLDLVCRLNGSSLINKIATKSEFDIDATKQAMIKKVLDSDEEIYPDDEQIRQIEAIDSCCGEEGFCMAFDEIIEDMCDYTLHLVYDYQAGAKTFCEIFIDYLQPILQLEKKASA